MDGELNIEELKKLVAEKDEYINKLKYNVKCRDIALGFCKQLIYAKLGIKLDDSIYEEPLVLYEEKTPIKYKKLKKKSPVKKKVVKKESLEKPVKKIAKKIRKKPSPPKSITFLDEKTVEEKQVDIDVIKDAQSGEIWEATEQECVAKISESMELLKTTRNYSKILNDIRTYRLYLLKFLGTDRYRRVMFEHISQIKNIFQQRGCDEKKIKRLEKQKFYSAYEIRMLNCNGFEKTTLEIDEIEIASQCYYYKNFGKTNYTVFNMEQICDCICDYQLCLSPLQKVLENVLTNKYGFNNIIYLPVHKDKNYSFYTLEKIGAKRQWVMDCHLADFMSELYQRVQSWMITKFRTMYAIIFHDNQYRKDFTEISQVLELEGIQLIKNLKYLSNVTEYLANLRNIIITHNTYQPTVKDEFNLFSDDPLYNEQDIVQNLNGKFVDKLFDNITSSEIDEVIKTDL